MAPTYYPQAHRWCLEKGLTMLGNSDIHEPDLDDGDQPSRRSSLTLVFAKERTLESLKEALFAGRTAVWCEGKLIGREEFLEPLFAGVPARRDAPFADRQRRVGGRQEPVRHRDPVDPERRGGPGRTDLAAAHH